jgi:hypothetical protein
VCEFVKGSFRETKSEKTSPRPWPLWKAQTGGIGSIWRDLHSEPLQPVYPLEIEWQISVSSCRPALPIVDARSANAAELDLTDTYYQRVATLRVELHE